MKNIYDGVVALDEKGEAEIELPIGSVHPKIFVTSYTAIGAPGPNLYIAYGGTNDSNNSSNNRFKIAGGAPGIKFSWHVTGMRIKIREQMFTGYKLKKISQTKNKASTCIQIFMVNQQRME